MDVRLDRDAFAKALGRVQGVVERRHTMPVLANALLTATGQGLEIVATDLEICVRSSLSDVDVGTPGSATVGARKLYEVVKELPDPRVELRSLETGWVEIRSGKALFQIAGLPADDFPTIPSVEEAAHYTLPEARLRRSLELVEYAISTDETRYHLNGVFLEVAEDGGAPEVRFVATDGHRLSLVRHPQADLGGLTLPRGVIVPRKAVVEIRKMVDGAGDVTVGFGRNHGYVRKESEGILYQYVDGEFPEYRRVIPSGNVHHLEVERTTLQRALHRMMLVATDRTRGIRLELRSGELRVSAHHPDVGEAVETIEASYDGAEMGIGFNASYLLDVLRTMEGDRIRMSFRDGGSQGVLEEVGNDRFLAIVMPMRI